MGEREKEKMVNREKLRWVLLGVYLKRYGMEQPESKPGCVKYISEYHGLTPEIDLQCTTQRNYMTNERCETKNFIYNGVKLPEIRANGYGHTLFPYRVQDCEFTVISPRWDKVNGVLTTNKAERWQVYHAADETAEAVIDELYTTLNVSRAKVQLAEKLDTLNLPPMALREASERLANLLFGPAKNTEKPAVTVSPVAPAIQPAAVVQPVVPAAPVAQPRKRSKIMPALLTVGACLGLGAYSIIKKITSNGQQNEKTATQK